MSKKTWLDDISQVVMAANNPQIALEDVAKTLPTTAQGDVATLRDILAGKIPGDKKLKKTDSLWTVLFRLVKQADKSSAVYLGQYHQLIRSRLSLESVFKTRFITYLYFVWLTLVLFYSLITLTNKSLPAFANFYAESGAALPALTQFIFDGKFLMLTVAVVLLVAIVAIIIPWLYRRRLQQLLPIPSYLRWFPFYFFLTRYYHRYLHTIFAAVYHQVGEDNPLQRGEKMLPKSPVDTVELRLLHVALRQGGFEQVLQSQQQQLADATLKHIRIADSIIGGVTLIIYAVLIYFYILGVYSPIFQLGGIIG